MELSVRELAEAVGGLSLEGDGSARVAAVTSDSRRCGPGVLFVAVPGTAADGHAYLEAARKAGSPVAVVQADRADTCARELAGFAAVLRAEATRPIPALAARELAGRPDRRLRTAGVTGTNGKTTVSFLLREMLARLEGTCGLIGTIRYDDGRENVPAPLTTPGGPVFYGWLARMADGGCRAVAMEISSHALDQDRTAGLELDVAVMTNLGRDHLDYHHDTASYLAAKARILELLRNGGREPGTLALNADDELLMSIDRGDLPTVLFSTGGRGAECADLVVRRAELGLTGTQLELDWRGERLVIDSPLVGRFNVENLTASLAAGLGLGLEARACAAALGRVRQVPGRLERFDLPQGALAVVDYAHTHDALEAVLGACDELGDGDLISVFGCGGDRDRGKRPLMGQVAARCSDRVWITSDNPRGEDPDAIIAMIVEGYESVADPRANAWEQIPDRAAAIEAALAAARRGDIVVIAGKGHEDYQLVGERVLHLDDREIVREWIARRNGGADA